MVFDMKTFIPYLFIFSVSSMVFAYEAPNMNLLSAEAGKTEMDNKQPQKPEAIEPAVQPYQTMDIDGLSAYISNQLSEVLVTDENPNENEKKAKLESIVSSALLRGSSMNDLRSAINLAVNNIQKVQHNEDTSKKLKQTSHSLNEIMGESNKVASTKNLPKTVTVLKGESLYKVAVRVYGRGNDYLRLYNANKGILSGPDIIQVGQVLQVP